MKIEELEFGDVISFEWKRGEFSKTATFINGVESGWAQDCIHSPFKAWEDDRVWSYEDVKCFLDCTEWHSELRYATQEEFNEIHKRCGGIPFQIGERHKIFKWYNNDEEIVVQSLMPKIIKRITEEYIKSFNKLYNKNHQLTPRQKAFTEYLTELHKSFIENGSTKGMSKIREKHRITGITEKDFYNTNLDQFLDIDYTSNKWVNFCCMVYDDLMNNDRQVCCTWYGER